MERFKQQSPFGRIMVNQNQARIQKYVASDPYYSTCMLAVMQDCKNVFKKICSSLLSSSTAPKSIQTIKLNGQDILWQHFEQAYMFNNETNF